MSHDNAQFDSILLDTFEMSAPSVCPRALMNVCVFVSVKMCQATQTPFFFSNISYEKVLAAVSCCLLVLTARLWVGLDEVGFERAQHGTAGFNHQQRAETGWSSVPDDALAAHSCISQS